MENKEVKEALDFLFDEAATEYEIDDGELIYHDCTNQDKYLEPANTIQTYIEQLEQENKMLKDKATPKEVLYEYDDEIIFCSCPNCAEILPDNWEVSGDTKYFNCPNCDQKIIR